MPTRQHTLLHFCMHFINPDDELTAGSMYMAFPMYRSQRRVMADP